MAQNGVQMHLGRPFYPGLLLWAKMDLDWVLGLHFLGSLLGILIHIEAQIVW
jgi:hypothetical protein